MISTKDRCQFSKIESEDLIMFICQPEKPSVALDHSALGVLELILKRLDMIDLDLIHNIFEALEGKYLSSVDWEALVETIRDFDP